MKIVKEDLLRNYPAYSQFQYCPETGLKLEPNQTQFTYDHWWRDDCVWKFHPMNGAALTGD